MTGLAGQAGRRHLVGRELNLRRNAHRRCTNHVSAYRPHEPGESTEPVRTGQRHRQSAMHPGTVAPVPLPPRRRPALPANPVLPLLHSPPSATRPARPRAHPRLTQPNRARPPTRHPQPHAEHAPESDGLDTATSDRLRGAPHRGMPGVGGCPGVGYTQLCPARRRPSGADHRTPTLALGHGEGAGWNPASSDCASNEASR